MSLLQRNILATTLVIAWLAAMAAAFWWFQFSNVQAFAGDNKTLVMFRGEEVANHIARFPAEDRRATVFHFWDEGCGCERFNREHVRQLMARYADQGVKFVVVVREPALIDEASKIFRSPALLDVELRDQWPEGAQPPSSPAVLIADENNELAYFGPYSIGAVCTAGQGNFVEKALDKLLDGSNPKMINTMAVGCFCPWRQQDNEV